MSKLILSLGLTLLITACATVPKPATAVASAKPGQQKLICVSYMETGHIVPRRLCHTEQQAAAQQNDDQQSVKNFQQQLQMQQASGMPPR
ncbi:MAG: hypothetical protein ACRESE_00735 [Gammaproteobacteria bacterium]